MACYDNESRGHCYCSSIKVEGSYVAVSAILGSFLLFSPTASRISFSAHWETLEPARSVERGRSYCHAWSLFTKRKILISTAKDQANKLASFRRE